MKTYDELMMEHTSRMFDALFGDPIDRRESLLRPCLESAGPANKLPLATREGFQEGPNVAADPQRPLPSADPDCTDCGGTGRREACKACGDVILECWCAVQS